MDQPVSHEEREKVRERKRERKRNRERGREKRKEKKSLNRIFRNNLVLVNVYLMEISYERHEQQKQLQTADLLSKDLLFHSKFFSIDYVCKENLG